MADRITDLRALDVQVIAHRYQVEKTLGKGGMAVVYQVIDTVTAKRVALKRLLAKEQDEYNREITRLFEYEFHALAQLAHPRVIEVYAYGKDDATPYYTMELLDGGDLRQLSPISWKEACSLMIDVCSALGLLHSRRQIHRDLTPLNIRCTKDHKAKLIDFGALTPMGPCKRLIGTPAFTAPEVVLLQNMDARTDLYSLGASFYYVVTNHHAFPARSFSDLAVMWRSQPLSPSTYKQEIPKELDQLILSLINPDPLARPVNVAEVMERLSAIAGLSIDDELVVSQSYLSTPVLAGRDEQITRIKKQLAQAQLSHGGTILIDGVPGVGHSRLLDAIVLEGKISGATVLRADASDAYAGDWGIVRVLISQLLDLIPDEALATAKPYVRVLGHVSPQLLERFEDTGLPLSVSAPPRSLFPISNADRPVVDPVAEVWGRGNSWRPPSPNRDTLRPTIFDNPQELRPRVQAALCDWLLEISERRLLMVAVDDAHRADEPSAAFLALLAHRIRKRKVIVAVTFQTKSTASSPAAIQLLKEAGTTVELRNLDSECTEKLLVSLFGEVPNRALLADRLYAISHGNPRMVMQLAQHLIERNAICYKAGTWTLPSDIDSGDLPNSISEAFRARIRKLSADALQLAQTMALSPDQSFSYEECLSLPEHRDAARVVRVLDELVLAEILSTDGKFYSFIQQVWVPELIGSIDRERAGKLHGRIAAVFEQRGDEALRAATHLLGAGQDERALDSFLHNYETYIEGQMQNWRATEEILRWLPPDWVDTLEHLLRVCERLGRPRRQLFILHNALVTLSAVTAVADRTHLVEVIEQLYRDSGLFDYDALTESVEEPNRLWRALELAQQRYDSNPESERVLAPTEAIRQLAQTTVVAISYAGTSLDYDLLYVLPSLKPLIPLSPAIEVVEKNVKTTKHLTGGRSEQARQGYLEVLERMMQPDHAGLEYAIYEPTRLTIMYAIALIEASLGYNSALSWIEEFEAHPLFQVNGWRIRMLYFLRQGDTYKANQCKKRLELLQIQHSPKQFFDGTYIAAEVMVYSTSDDLVGIKQSIECIKAIADRFKGWLPLLYFAQAEYHRIRGDYTGALAELDSALRLTAPGRYYIWPYLVGCYVLTLYRLQRFDEAKKKGDELLKAAEDANLDINTIVIKRPLALIEAKRGNYRRAVSLVQSVIDQTIASEITGLNLGLAYETRARVAIDMNDQASFNTYAELCAQQYRTGTNPVLAARYHNLMQEAREANLIVSGDLAGAAEMSEIRSRLQYDESAIVTILDNCRETQKRASRVLNLLIKRCNCSGGYLYAMQKEGLVLLAKSDEIDETIELTALVEKRILIEINDDQDVVTTTDEKQGASSTQPEWIGPRGEKYRAVLLGHYYQENFAITGIAVLLLDQNKPFIHAGELASAISKTLFDAGDVSIIVNN
ncbi:MAG: protein kinase [Deltaproteobacteria bacterium]|nr:protein kinase [Deltaproteobacteria bacterium]